MNTRYLVICEGVSECNYLQHLQRFVRELPLPVGTCSQLNFIGLPKSRDPQTLQRKGVGTGEYGKVVRAYKAERKRNRSAQFLIWVDDDLYVRNDKGCGVNYERKPQGIPDFSFSVHNFEDFVALHLPAELFERWRVEMSRAGHFENPLHGEDYGAVFEKILPKYQKGELPDGFVSVESLSNMIRHIGMLPEMSQGCLTRRQMFANDLAAILKEAYPDVFGSRTSRN